MAEDIKNNEDEKNFKVGLIPSAKFITIEALETHLRLRIFEDDWDYPGMEAYDDL